MGISSIKILAVEDDAIYAESLSLIIRDLGYELTGIADSGLVALALLEESIPDLILMDIDIKGQINGLELAAQINLVRRIPIIFVTAFKDIETFKLAKLTFPKAYIIKPYDPISLQSAIELSMFSGAVQNSSVLQPKTMGDTFYIKDNNRLVKIRLRDIVMVEADENYCFIDTNQKRYVINMTLRDLLDRLPREEFVQVHRSFVVRKSAIEEVNIGEQTLKVAEKNIPIGKTYKEQLLTTLNLLF
ncbi:MAG: LytTR family transcriptional regulator DNA-binding domain-containing protein [Chryseolinea sp.]